MESHKMIVITRFVIQIFYPKQMKSNYTKVRFAQFLMFTLSLFAFLTVSTRMNGQATLPHLEPMNYTAAAALQTQTGWTAVNSGDDIVVASGSLSYSGLPASTGNKVTYAGTGIDAAKLFTQQTSGTVYASFIINVAALGSLNATGGYTLALNEGTGTNYGATVWLRADGTGFDIGVNPRTTAANTQWSTGTQTVGTPLFVVISYQMVSGTLNDVVKMWINPALGGSEPTATLSATNGLTDLANVNRFFIRQDAAASTPSVELDEVRIATSWASVTPAGTTITPSTASLTNFGSVSVGASSTASTFTVTGSNLTGGVTVTRPSTDFEISADGVDWSNATLTLTQTAGVLDGSPVTIYVRCSPASAGPLSGNVALSSSGATTVNVAVTGTGVGVASQTSDIIVDGGFTYTSNIAYGSYQSADVTNSNSVAIGQFIIRDGGASAPDADALSTILNSISFSVTNPASLRSVALYDGTTELGEVAGGATLSFTGLTVAAADDATKTLTLYATFNSSVTDNQQFSVALATADDDNSGSLFGTLGTPVTTTTAEENKIEVTATALTFFVQPVSTPTGSAMAPAPIVRAIDALSNRDLDYVTAIDITSSGTLTGSPVSVVPTTGSATFSSLVHTAAGSARQLTATSGSLSVVSSSFNIITLIAAWDFTGESATVAVATSAAEVYDALLDNSASQSNLTRGAGAAGSTGSNSFRTVGFQNNGIATTNTDYFQFTLAPTTGNSVSVSTIDARFAGTASFAASPGVSNQFAYSLNGTTFTLIGSSQVIVGTPSTLAQIDVSGISELQNVSSGTITFRYYASGQTTSGGWGFNSPSAGQYGLSIGGSVAPVDCNDNTACNYNALATGTTQCQYATTTYYIDIDGDGYASGTIVACAPSAGYTTTVLPTTDCNDASAVANPAASEIACDGIDNDCNTIIDDGSITGCLDPLASNYNAATTCPVECTYTGSFTAGNLVVSRMGAGVAYPATSGTTYEVFLEELTPTGTSVFTYPMPTVGSKRLTQAASSTAEGFITRTPNGEAIVFAGYDAAPAVAGLTGLPRVANVIGLNYATTRAFSSSSLYSGGTNFRSVASDGTNYWTSGSSVGINYVTGGTPTVISSAITNTRVINTFNGNLYFSTGSGTPGIYKVGTGLPTSSTTNTAVVTSAGSSPYDFVFSPDGNTLYVADDRATTAGGVYKYTFDGSVWTQAAQFYLGASYPSASSLVVDFYTYAQPKLYVVARLNTTSQSIVVSFDDNGATGTITPTFATISTSPAFTTYRAIEFAPCVGQVWYADADGDSYGNPLVTLTNCTQPYGYVSNSLDCNDASANAYPGATEICNGGDDDCDTTIDEACINVAVNNNRANATATAPSTYPVCSNIAGNLAAATPDVVGEGADLWYRFTAASNAARILVTGGSATNTLIEVETAAGVTVGSIEDASSSNGNEIFLTDGLTVGQQYYVAVRNAGGVAGTYNVCIQALYPSSCDNGPNFSNLCSQFKADWTGTSVYSATFTSVSDPANTYSYTTTSGSYMPLSAFVPSMSNTVVGGLQYGQSYSVVVSSIFTLADAAGNIGTYTATPSASNCTVNILAQPNINLGTTYASSGVGLNPRNLNSYVATNAFVCGVVSYNWMFVPVDPLTNAPLTTELTAYYNSGSSSRYMQLSATNIPGLAAGKRYRVHVQPVFASGVGSFDMVSVVYVQMISSGGMVTENGTDAMVSRSFTVEPNEATSIAVYPNPSNGEVFNLNVSGIAEGLWEMSILDIQGKEVMNGQLISENGINTMVVPTTKLTAGIYMINLTNGVEILSTRLVVR
jgi:hypothetical protein